MTALALPFAPSNDFPTFINDAGDVRDCQDNHKFASIEGTRLMFWHRDRKRTAYMELNPDLVKLHLRQQEIELDNRRLDLRAKKLALVEKILSEE